MKCNVLSIVAVVVLFSIIVYMGQLNNQRKEEIATLKKQIVNLNDRNYHDSTMLSDYQQGLDEFMYQDPIAAERFMQCVERAFE